MSFLPKMCRFFSLLLPLSPSQKSMSAFVRFNLASDDSKSLSVSGRAAVSGWHHFPSEQRARPVWTLGDTWGSNVAGHVSAGPLIRGGDSQTCCGCLRAQRSAPFHRPYSENWGVRGRWIEIKPQVLLSLSQHGERYFYLKSCVFSRSLHSKETCHQNFEIYGERKTATVKFKDLIMKSPHPGRCLIFPKLIVTSKKLTCAQKHHEID